MAGGDAGERTSLIVTVLDEAESVDDLLHSIEAQTRRPDEVVIVDGGSRDGTWERLEAWMGRFPLRLVREQGASIARGRNLGIGAARHDLIAVTDAGVRLDPDWLAQLVAKLRSDVDVVSGFFRPDPRTVFECALGATVLPAEDDIKEKTFLPSSRSVLFRRRAWERAGGYPEWLDYCEDLVFDLTLKGDGCRFALAPRAVAWFRPRSSLRAFFRQYYLYARGDGKADLWRVRHAIRYSTYVMAAVILARWRSAGILLLTLGGALYTRRPLQRLAPHLPSMSLTDAVRAVALVPVIRLVGDLAKMLGYPVGVAWRVRRR
jgi:glycosyltransferase involved in cell wall biosynthesis